MRKKKKGMKGRQMGYKRRREREREDEKEDK